MECMNVQMYILWEICECSNLSQMNKLTWEMYGDVIYWHTNSEWNVLSELMIEEIHLSSLVIE